MKVVKTRSIPNVDDERLIDSLSQLHQTYHTPEGLHSLDVPRRQLVNNGIKARRIKNALEQRGVPTPPCPYCDGGPRIP